MRRIMIATPVKGGLSAEFVQQIVACLTTTYEDYSFSFNFCGGTSVALARNELANIAIRQGHDSILWWDKDLGERSAQLQLNLVARILSHPEPIVSAQYCTHKIPSIFHGTKFDSEANPNEKGLLRMHQMPIGFCKMDTEALKTIMRATPERAYWGKELGGEASSLHEFFPTGIIGPNTPEYKLKQISYLIPCGKEIAGFEFEEYLARIRSIIDDADYSQNTMYGEDFFFCKLARDAGVPLYIDTTAVIPHASTALLPLPIETLRSEIDADWRKP